MGAYVPVLGGPHQSPTLPGVRCQIEIPGTSITIIYSYSLDCNGLSLS